MADPDRLTLEQLNFIEDMGVYYDHFGLPRLVGRLVGLLMLADQPLTLDDMAHALLVSRASISTNIRIALHNEFVVRVGIPGDRRDFYRFSDDVWERRTAVIEIGSKATRVFAERGLAALDPDDTVARARLEEMVDYSNFMIAEGRSMLERWRERKRQHASKTHVSPLRRQNDLATSDKSAVDGDSA